MNKRFIFVFITIFLVFTIFFVGCGYKILHISTVKENYSKFTSNVITIKGKVTDIYLKPSDIPTGIKNLLKSIKSDGNGNLVLLTLNDGTGSIFVVMDTQSAPQKGAQLILVGKVKSFLGIPYFMGKPFLPSAVSNIFSKNIIWIGLVLLLVIILILFFMKRSKRKMISADEYDDFNDNLIEEEENEDEEEDL